MTDETVANPAESSTPALSKRLTPREYAKAKSMWQSGDYSLSEISEAVGVSATALSRRFKKDGVKRGSFADKTAAAVQKSIERTAAAQAEELASYAHDLKMNALKAIDLFNRKAYADVAKAIKDGTPVGERLTDLKAISEASKIISQNYQTGANILGLDRELDEGEELSELRIKIMTEEDVKELREKQRREAAEAAGEMIDDELEGLTPEELEELDEILVEGEPEEAA
jgi:AraC-like DNA-binding protein